MNRIVMLSLVICLVIPATALPGPLLIVGGGAVPAPVRRAFVEIAGGNKAVIAVLPQASSRTERGRASIEAFRKLGVAEAYVVDDPKSARELINKATAFWFPGGSQAQLYEAMKQARLVELLQSRHRAGIPFGGTSAGAAIMSELMIPRAPKKSALTTGNTPVTKGLALAPEFIIDQHFVVRGRMNRLLGATLDHPDRIGVGIGESTAIMVSGDTFSVLGKGSVVVIDARKAETSQGKEGSLQHGSDVRLHVLKAGQRYRFK